MPPSRLTDNEAADTARETGRVMEELDLLNYYLEVLVGMLGTPFGVVGLVGLLAMVAAAAVLPSARWVFLTLAIYFATLPLVDVKGRFAPLAFPLEQFRQFARPMIYVFVGLLLLPLLISARGWRRSLLSWPLLLFFAFQISVCLRLIVFGNEFRGVLSVITFTLLLLTLGLALSRWLQSIDDLYKLIWSVSCVGGLVILGTFYQLLINRSSVLSGNRLTGITGNPQFLGIIIAFTLPFTAHLLSRRGGRVWIRPLLIAQIGLTIVFLTWTGSRTGALATACALIVVFHRKIGRMLIAGAFVAIAVIALLPYFEGSSEIASRLISMENSRAGVWPSLFRTIREHFWFGEARETLGGQESSYLSILGQFGIIGSLPFIASAAALIVQLIQMRQLRRYLGSEADLIDMICGVWAAVAIAAALEGILLGVITYSIFAVYVFFTVNTFLLDWCRACQESAAELPPPDEMRFAA